MTLLQLQYFITVCEHQSLTKTARERSISQPGISTSMRELETECGFPLFEHHPNSIVLPSQGRAFLREAEHMIHAYGQLRENTQPIAQEKTIFRVGVATMGAGLVFPRLRKGFYAAHPEITLEVTEDSTEALCRRIDARELDFAVGVSIAPPDENYRYVTLGHSWLMFCVHGDRPLAQCTIHSLAEIGQTPLVMLSDRYSQTKYSKRLFRETEFVPNVIQSGRMFAILQYIRENAAGGFLSEDVAGYEGTCGALRYRKWSPP